MAYHLENPVRWFESLAVAVKSLPLGTAYSIGVGVGAFGTATLGIVLLGEPSSPARLVCIRLILAGIIGAQVLHGELTYAQTARGRASQQMASIEVMGSCLYPCWFLVV